MSHLYEELAKRKALLEKVNKLQNEVDQLDSKSALHDKSTIASTPSASVYTSVNARPSAQSITAVASSSSVSSSLAVSHAKPLVPVTTVYSPAPSVVSKPATVMSIPSGTLVNPLQQHYITAQPQLVNTFQPLLRASVGVGVPVQMVSYINKDGNRINNTSSSKSRRIKQKGSAKKKPKMDQQSQSVSSVTQPSSAVLLSPQLVASQTTPTGSTWQSPSVSRAHHSLITSPVTPVNSSFHSGNDRSGTVSLVTSPVTPTPVRLVSSDLSSVVSLPSRSASSGGPGSEVPPMVSFVQSGLSCISPLSPLSTMSSVSVSRPLTSGATPLSSLSASTQKYLNTFTTQSTETSRSFPASTNQSSFAGRTSFLNTDLSTDHSAGIKLLCDLLNDTLPEQPPPLVATSLAVRSLGTPTSVTSASSVSSVVEQGRHPTTPPTLPSRSSSKSPRTPPLGNTLARPSPGGTTSSSEQTATHNTPPTAEAPAAAKKRTSPFTIENLVSSSPEKSKSPAEAGVEERHPSPGSAISRSSPKGKNKSPSTNFSIAHITRDMIPSSKERVPFVTGPVGCSVPTSVSPGQEKQNQRRISPPLAVITNPEHDGLVVVSTGIKPLNTVQSSTDQNSNPIPRKEGELKREQLSPPVARVCSESAHMNSYVPSNLVSKSSALKQEVIHSEGKNPISKHHVDRNCLDSKLISPTPDRTQSQKAQPVSDVPKDKTASSEVTSSVPSSTSSPECHRPVASTHASEIISDVPLDMIPLPSGKRPSPTSLSGKTGSANKKRRSPVSQIPKSASPDFEVTSLMTNEALPQSPSISSSVSKATAVLEGQAPVLVDSNPCSARSPIPAAPSSLLQPQSGVSLPSFGSVFSLPKEEETVTSEKSAAKSRYGLYFGNVRLFWYS